ncbi:MAG: trypsin-like serine protease [Betaproteobacteria bacterium]|nr:trypsin-like serine protease [Betaproteobacteria bacterium]
MNRPFALATALAAVIVAFPVGAILIRPDRDDEEYRELATRYPSALALSASGGAGVLIAPRWVLTTARQAKALDGKNPSLRIGSRDHAIQEIFVHPDWKPGAEADVALLYLRESVQDIEPTPIYRDSDEDGRTARIVGFGETGRIGTKPAAPADRRARAAVNTVDRVAPRTLGLRIKPPEDASDLQGAAAPGDGGAPAFFEIDGRILVGGLYCATEDTNGDGIFGNIGDSERYTRVSAFAEWIQVTAGKAAADEAAAAVGDTERR